MIYFKNIIIYLIKIFKIFNNKIITNVYNIQNNKQNNLKKIKKNYSKKTMN